MHARLSYHAARLFISCGALLTLTRRSRQQPRLALIRKAGVVTWPAAAPMSLATVIGPRALVAQPIDFRTLLLHYMVAIAITVDQPRIPGAPPKIRSPCIKIPLPLPLSLRCVVS